jgi:hypothetical protein
MTDTDIRARLALRATDPAVQDWQAQHATDTHPPCDRCGATSALRLTTCARCTFALCPKCYVLHLVTRYRPGHSTLCNAAVEWATFHAALRTDNDTADPTADDFAAARVALKGYLRC